MSPEGADRWAASTRPDEGLTWGVYQMSPEEHLTFLQHARQSRHETFQPVISLPQQCQKGNPDVNPPVRRAPTVPHLHPVPTPMTTSLLLPSAWCSDIVQDVLVHPQPNPGRRVASRQTQPAGTSFLEKGSHHTTPGRLAIASAHRRRAAT